MPADAVSTVAGSLNPPQWVQSDVVTAGAHCVAYEPHSSIPWGPDLYRATVAGPMGSSISRQLTKYPVFAPNSPYQSTLGWYAFVEWRADGRGEGSSAIRIFDLAKGKIINTRKVRFAGFIGWRGGVSTEYIVQNFGVDRRSQWFACAARRGRKRLLFHGGWDGHMSSDGRYLLVIHTRPEVFVALISIDSATVLDLKKALDFQASSQEVVGLDTVSFDARAVRLTSMLNCARMDLPNKQAVFGKLIAIEVSKVADPGSTATLKS